MVGRWRIRAFCAVWLLASQPTFGELEAALIMMGQTHSYWQALQRGAEDAARRHNVQLTSLSPRFENETLSQQGIIRRALQLGSQALVIAPNDKQAQLEVLQQARADGVVVVVVDSPLAAELDGLVASDNFAAGVMLGRYVVAHTPAAARVMLLCGPLSIGSLAERYRGLRQALEPRLVVEALTANLLLSNEGVRHLRQARQQLAQMDVVVACNESSTDAMLAHFGTSAAGQPQLYGFDITAEFLRALETGQLQALVMQDPYAMGQQAIAQLLRIMAGERVSTVRVATHLLDRQGLGDARLRQIAHSQM